MYVISSPNAININAIINVNLSTCVSNYNQIQPNKKKIFFHLFLTFRDLKSLIERCIRLHRQSNILFPIVQALPEFRTFVFRIESALR